MLRNILIAAGGTGGHIIPAIELGTMLDSSNVHYVCGNREIETRIYSKRNIDPKILPFSNYRTFINLVNMLFSIPEMIIFIIRNHIDIVIMMGSYVTFTTGLASMITMRPIILMEQDIIAGRNIRFMSLAASYVFTAFNKPYRGINRHKRLYTGHFIGKHADTQNKDTMKLFDNDNPLVLVTGGSQGALNMYRSIYPILKNSPFNAVFVGSGMEKHFSNTENVRVLPYTDDMGSLYKTADIIISRAGAMSMAEIINACKPAIFIPLPSSTDNHQEKNIHYYMKYIRHIGCLNEDEISNDKIISMINDLINRNTECTYKEHGATDIIREILYV